jgi:hypothetical protein
LTAGSRKRHSPVWAGAVMLLIAAPVLACINTYTGGIKEAHSRGDNSAMVKILAQLEATYANSPNIESANDLAVAWVLTGRVADGIKLLRDLEKEKPGNAIVAANLGTALELSGDDEEALTWIRESVRRDPNEHEGSEWVHVKILEAKIILKKNPNWLRTRSVVGWREGQQLMADDRGRVRSPADLIRPISYQLKERTQFVQPPDDVVGDLYLTLGDVAHSTSAAYPTVWERDDAESTNYEAALRYGTVHEVRVRERLEAANRRIEASRPERQAAVRREQEARVQAEQMVERKRLDSQNRVERQQEQSRRRQLALWMFIALGAAVTAVLVWRRKRATA